MLPNIFRYVSEDNIKRYIDLKEKAKLALAKTLTEQQSIDMQILQASVTSRYYKNASYASHLVYQALDSLQKDGIVGLKDNKPTLVNITVTTQALSNENNRVKDILNSEWGAGDFRYLADFGEALHIIARLIIQGAKTTSKEIIASMENDVYERLGAFKNLSSSQATYRRRVIIPRAIKMLEELKILESNRLDGSITLPSDKLQLILSWYGNEIFGIVEEVAIAQKKKIEAINRLYNEANNITNKLKEENSSLTITNKNLDEELRVKESAIAHYKIISNFIDRTKIIGIDVNWIITCTALNLVETAIKKKLIDMGVSRDKVLNKEFEENSKLLEKLLVEQENRKLTSRLLFNDVYKKARAKIDHEGHLHKPSLRECTYIVDETVDFIDELFNVSSKATTILPSTGKWNPLPVIKFNVMGVNLKRALPQVGWELTNHSLYQLKIRIEVHPWLGKRDLFPLVLDGDINGKKSYSAEPNSVVWTNGTFTLPKECVNSTEELVLEIRSFVTDVNEPQKGEHKMLSSTWKYVRAGDYWYYYPQGP
jgi:hypothetical protein